MQQEEWRDVVGHEDKYEVSSLGRVRTKPKYLRPWNTNGYEYISIGRGVKTTVHKLVCEAFHGEKPDDKHLVAHGDGTRNNNTKGNLRWATYSENLSDSVKHGTCRLPQYKNPRKGAEHGMSKLTYEIVSQIKHECSDGVARLAVAEKYGISRNHLWRILRGMNWKAM